MANIDRCLEIVRNGNVLSERDLRLVCEKVKDIFVGESNVRNVRSPVTVCGDIHG